jgi:tape measure domain-containing protein
MAFTSKLGEAVIAVRVQTDKLRQGLNKAVTQTQSAAGRMKAAFASVSSSFGALAIAAGLFAVGKAAVTASARLETLEVSFTALLGSAEKARDVLEQIKQFSAGTPFQLEGIAGAARQLLAAGTNTDVLLDRLRVLGDVASGANIPLNDMAQIFAKIKNKGRAYTEELLQLSDRGIPILQTLATQLGVTKDEVFKLASEGKLSFEIMLEALRGMTSEGGPFFDQMATQSLTLEGRFSTLKDNLTLLAAAWGEVLAPVIKVILELFIELVQIATEVITILKDMAATVINVVVKAFEKMKKVVLDVTRSVASNFTWLFGQVTGSTGVSGMADQVGADMGRMETEMVSRAQSATAKTAETFKELKKDVTKETEDLSNSVENLFSGLFSKLTGQSISIGGSGVGGGSSGGLGGILGNLIGGLFGGGGGGGGGFNFGSIFSSIFGGFFADGGRPPLGKVSVVGERGPELFVPDSAGTIIPNGGMGGDIVVNQTISLMPDVGTAFKQQLAEAMPMIKNASVEAVAEARARRGGFL